MRFWCDRVFLQMFFSRNNFEMDRITARPIFACVVQDFIFRYRADKQMIGQLVSTQLPATESCPAVALHFSSDPIPTIRHRIDENFIPNPNREIIEHDLV